MGYGPEDCKSIQEHRFFSTINWNDLMERKVQPEFVPQVRSDTDVQFFDTEFTSEKVVDSLVSTIADVLLLLQQLLQIVHP